ncbi:MAG TPA: response regulator transcription factor [Kofleriaceae bacterium]|jgi:DNA-binding NarL/FixJ family response regulator|nr:response regulator transcription factor [Kofleriaceae bacterium]
MALAIDVALVEDDRSTREGLAMLIDGTPGFRCRSLFGSIEDALDNGPTAPPDVILCDIHLPGEPGSTGVAKLADKYASTAILMLTGLEQHEWVFEALSNGACGYLLKKTPPARLLESIREAHEGGSPMSPEIARAVISTFRKSRRPVADSSELSDNEVTLLGLLAEGHTYESAARQMAVSINTVRNYIRSVYVTLHVHSKSEAVSRAIKRGLI